MRLGNGTTETNWPLRKTWTLQKSHASTLLSSRPMNRETFGEQILGLIVRSIENTYSAMYYYVCCANIIGPLLLVIYTITSEHHVANLLFGPYNWNPGENDTEYCSWDTPTAKVCKTHFYEKGLIYQVHAAGAEIYVSRIGIKTIISHFFLSYIFIRYNFYISAKPWRLVLE